MLKSHIRHSLAYLEGQRARRDGLKLEETAIKNLKSGTRQFKDYMAGFEALEVAPVPVPATAS